MRICKKKKYFKLSLMILFLIATTGCFINQSNSDPSTEPNVENNANKYFYDSTTGTVYTNLSDRFDFKIESWDYYYDEESNQNRVLLSIGIKNKTGVRLNNFVGTILFNESLYDLIASGITTYDRNEPVDLIPETSANGVFYSLELLIEKDEVLDSMNVDKDESLDRLRYITFDLRWDGGEETVEIVCDELNYSES